ncbi:unnamed protein product [Heterobilharzia americana]|nr:unnamed protein product [Heterobilharzia americana]
MISAFIQHSTLINPNCADGSNVDCNNKKSSVNSSSSTGTSAIIDNQCTRKPSDIEIDHLNLKRPRLQKPYDNCHPTDSVHSPPLTYSKNPLDLTEEEQLLLAIEASKEEANKQSNDSRRPLTEDDEVVLTDDDDEETNRSTVSDIDIDRQEEEKVADCDTGIRGDRNVINSNGQCSLSFVSSTTATITARRPLRPEKSSKSKFFRNLKPNTLYKLPSPAAEEPAVELLIRLPDGSREVYRLHPTLTLEDLHSYFEYRGYPQCQYEIIRVYPRLCLSTMPQSISLTVAGLCTKDTLFIQER